MSGEQFVETLRQIGYPRAQSTSARGFDWMFEDESVLPFLSWFCNTVGHQNALSEGEKREYADLQQTGGDSLLEGAVLDEALACLSSQDDANLETLQDDVERMKEDLDRLQKKKEKLVKTRNTLSLHQTGLTHRLAKFSDLEMAKKQGCRKSIEECHRSNAECNASLQRLGESVHRLCSLYSDQVQSERAEAAESEAVFLSQLSFNSFHSTEENYSRELTSFTKKLFFEGIADIAGGELSRYQLLEVSDPTSLLVKGPSQEAFLQDCRELARLQTVFPKSEGERINALVEARCAANVSAAADEFLRRLQAGQIPSDIQELTRQMRETKLTLGTVREELHRLTDGEVSDLVKELGQLQATRVLTGDYRIKLTRQDYFTANQDQVIKYLVEQRARNEFLTMAYEVEARNHRDIHRLLTAVRKTLQERLTLYQSRMQAMEDPSLTKTKYDRGTIDTRDVASTCLHQMLVPVEEGDQRQLFLSYASMMQAAEALQRSLTHAKAEAVATADKYQDSVNSLEREVLRCEDVLYAGCSTAQGQPTMMPGPLLEATSRLEDAMHKVEASLRSTITTLSDRKKELSKDVLLVKERELFTYFHLHPERLIHTVDKLEKRLQAHTVK